MLRSLLVADTSPVSPHLLLWQHHHVLSPTVPLPPPAPISASHLSGPALLPSPPAVRSTTDPFPTPFHTGLHQLFTSSTQRSVPVSLPLTPFSPDRLHKSLLSSHFNARVTPPFPPAQQHYTQLASLVPEPHRCYRVGDPLQKCFSQSLESEQADPLSGTRCPVNPQHRQRAGICLAKAESEILASNYIET